MSFHEHIYYQIYCFTACSWDTYSINPLRCYGYGIQRHFQQYFSYIEYTTPWERLELTTLVVIGTDCTGSYKSNYHMITTTTAPYQPIDDFIWATDDFSVKYFNE